MNAIQTKYNSLNINKNTARGALLGLSVGDALGVPFEFKSRATLNSAPATGMSGYGTHNQPPGTWSDDSSLTFCLAESLLHGFDLYDMAHRMIAWKNEARLTAHGQVFDIGVTTARSLDYVAQFSENEFEARLQLFCEQAAENQNGNGSLMRILPLLFYLGDMPAEQQFGAVWQVSAITHPPLRAAIACMAFLRCAYALCKGHAPSEAVAIMQVEMKRLWSCGILPENEKPHFSRTLSESLAEIAEDRISSDGYVIHTLEAALWCLLRNFSYKDTVLAAVNLGNDTDTTAAVAGGLAGLHYGVAGIPSGWLEQLARVNDIVALADRLYACYPC